MGIAGEVYCSMDGYVDRRSLLSLPSADCAEASEAANWLKYIHGWSLHR